MAEAEVYEAYDEDYEGEYADYDGGEGEEYFINEHEHLDDDGADEDEFGPGVTVTWAAKPKKQVKPVSDVADAAYLDPFGLVNCWEEALSELKAAHPDRFLPPTEAPLPLSHRQAKAPLWYGPSTTPNPPPVASTSRIVPSDPTTRSVFSHPQTLSINPTRQGRASPTEEEEPPTKKRKRLTGSQKKARKAAKLANGNHASTTSPTGYETGRVLNPLHVSSSTTVTVPPGGAEADVRRSPRHSPGYEPQSPKLSPRRDRTLRSERIMSTTTTTTTTICPRSKSPGPTTGPRAPCSASSIAPKTPRTASAFPPPPPPSSVLSRLPVSFPSPPPITPLTGQEPALEPETPESLLESALWSWYTAGYQTALYHASVGVATFKPSEVEENAMSE